MQLNQVRQVFLDMDGTIYHGTDLFPTTIPFLNFLKEKGIKYTFLSNNSSFSTAEYIAKLKNMGIEAAENEFYISTDYAIDYLKRNHPELRKLYLMGMECIFPAFEKAGFTLTDNAPDAVVVAFDRTLTYEKLCKAAWFMKQDLPAFATHPDVFCPTNQQTWLPDCGAFIACLETATGKKLKVLGKPDPGILVEGAARNGIPVTSALMVGDRLHTDIAVGRNAGALTAWITPDPACEPNCPAHLAPHFKVRDLGELQTLWETEK